MPPYLTFSIIRKGSKVKWSNQGKGLSPSPTPRCSSYWKGSLWSPSTNVANFTYFFLLTFIGFLLQNIQTCWTKVKLATVIEGDSKDPFSTAATPRCRRGRYSVSWFAPLYPYLIMLSVKQGASSTIFWLDPGLNPGLPDHWRTLYPLDQ